MTGEEVVVAYFEGLPTEFAWRDWKTTRNVQDSRLSGLETNRAVFESKFRAVFLKMFHVFVQTHGLPSSCSSYIIRVFVFPICTEYVKIFQIIVTELIFVFKSSRCGWRRRPPDMEGSCHYTGINTMFSGYLSL